MSTVSQVAAVDPVNLIVSKGLAAGTRYLIQNVSEFELHYALAAAAPDLTDADLSYHSLGARGTETSIIGLEVGNLGFWIWSPTSGVSGAVSVSEEA